MRNFYLKHLCHGLSNEGLFLPRQSTSKSARGIIAHRMSLSQDILLIVPVSGSDVSKFTLNRSDNILSDMQAICRRQARPYQSLLESSIHAVTSNDSSPLSWFPSRPGESEELRDAFPHRGAFIGTESPSPTGKLALECNEPPSWRLSEVSRCPRALCTHATENKSERSSCKRSALTACRVIRAATKNFPNSFSLIAEARDGMKV